MVGLADCNSFYASCEQVFDRKLKNKPVLVLSNNDGCVVSRSGEAKALVEMGVPFFQIKEIVERHGMAVFSSNYPLYGDLSKRVMQIFKRFVAEVEVYSIDECFLDLRGYPALEEYGQQLRDTVLQWTGVPTTIGISHTKVLAKVANKLAKKQGMGSYLLRDAAEIREVLEHTLVGDLWGIGRQYTQLLQKNGICTAWQLREQSDHWVRKHLSVVGLRLVKELRGEPCIPLELITEPKKNILVSRTFAGSLESLDELKERVAGFASRVAEKLRAQGSAANLLSVFVRTDHFRQDEPQYRNSTLLRFKEATSFTPEIVSYALAGLQKIYREGYRYRKAGVTLTGIVPADQVQLNLFHQTDQATKNKQHKLMQALDTLNRRMGSHTVRVAAAAANPFPGRQERLSQRYTTSWNDILTVWI